MSERQRLAERWRLAGEKLRERSPELFEKFVAMAEVSALGSDSGEEDESVCLIN